MTIGELQAKLANLDAGREAMILLNGQFVPVVDVTQVAGAEFILLRGKANLEQSKKFTVSEQGLLGHLARLGLRDDKIAEILGRATRSVARKRRDLGF